MTDERKTPETSTSTPPSAGTAAPEPTASAPQPATVEESSVGTAVAEAPPPTPPPEVATGADEPAPSNKHWYVDKVQSGREESIKEAIERRVRIEGLEEYFGQIISPVERVTEMRNSKRVVRERKLYPGYLMVEVEFNDRILYLFRETAGVGDFVGGSLNHAPPPMSEREVERMLGRQGEEVAAKPAKPKYDKGDRVKVRDGTFAGME